MKTKIFLPLFLLFSAVGQAQNKVIDALLNKPIKISLINGDTFLQRNLTDYLNVTLGATNNFLHDIESDTHMDLSVLKDYFMRPHPSISTVQKYFNTASKEFGVPVSLLMIIGQIENNWTQTGPTIDQGWGIMHLVKNDYCNSLGEASKLIGVSEQVLKDNALQNIRGAAALIAKYAGNKKNKFTNLEDWFPALSRFSALISPELREMQAKNYFETLNNGVISKTVWGEQIVIEGETISKKILDSFDQKEFNENTVSRSLSADYGPALTNSAASCNYATGRGHSIDTWVNHWIGTGTYLGTISWFQTCPCPSGTYPGNCPGTYRGCNGSTPIGASSAHFVIKNSNGEITQMVAVANTAYHCGASGFPANNTRSIGVEHEATAANPGMWNSVPMLNASATMACYFKQLYGFPTTQNSSPGICGHNDMPGTTTTCPGSLPWSNWMSYFNSACTPCTPPTNDVCSSNIPTLTVGATCSNTSGNINCATQSNPASGCPSGLIQDVWYKFTATASGPCTIRLSPSTGMDGVVEVRQGSCTGAVLGCADVGGGNGAVENLNVTVSIGATYYIRVYEYNPPGNTTPPSTTSFNICVIGAGGLPDLSITAGTQTVTPLTVNAGSSVNVSCSEDNTGNVIAGANHVTLWLSADGTLNTSNDVLLGQIPFPSLPANSNSLILNTNVQIPANTCSGNYFLFFWADGNLAVTESNEGNNFASRSISVNSTFNAGTVSGTSPLCIGATATYSSNGTAGGTWSSPNTSVATVNPNTGLVTAVSAGTTNITYTVGSGCGSPASSFKTLTVTASVSSGTVSGSSPLCIGVTATYTSNGTAGGTWSSSNTNIATINTTTGLVTTVSAGTTNITYTVGSGCGSPTSSFKTLTVIASVSAGTVSGSSPLCIGATATYNSSGTAGGTWSSSNTSVATVNANTGLVTPVSAGTTNITYMIGSGCGSPASSFKTLTVTANVSAGTISGTSPTCIGATTAYTTSGTAGGTWSSSNTSVATVNATTGLVTAVSTGTTNIVYTVTGCNGISLNSSKTLTVNQNVSAGTVSGTSPLCIGTIATFISNRIAGGTWSSSNISVATVNASTGLVTSVSAGTTSITYAIGSGCGSPVSSSRALVVSSNVIAGTVSGTSPLCIGATATYTSNGETGGTWSSSNTSVATINASMGLVTAVSGGTTNISYTVGSGCRSPVSSSKSITVSSSINAGTINGASPLCTGTTATYTSNGTSGGTWSSSNTSVATINSSTGLVTALSAGTANIVYTVTSCSGNILSTSSTLTVTPNIFPSIAISQTSCVGTTVSFASTITNGGSNPAYLWSFNGTGSSPNFNGPTFTLNNATNNTQVQCTLTSNAGCANPNPVTSSALSINCIITGAPSANGLEEFRITPNPSNGLFTVRIKLNTIKEVSFKLYNMTGQILYQSEIFHLAGTLTKDIDGSRFANGVYLLETKIGKESIFNKIMISR